MVHHLALRHHREAPIQVNSTINSTNKAAGTPVSNTAEDTLVNNMVARLSTCFVPKLQYVSITKLLPESLKTAHTVNSCTCPPSEFD